MKGLENNTYIYVGGSIRDFGDCVYDIAGAVQFISDISNRIILQGHSLGCDRVVHYQLVTRRWHDTVLLSPCDNYALQRNFRAPESVEAQITRLQTRSPGHQFELLAPKEYGVTMTNDDYRIPVNLRTFLSIAGGPPFTLFRLDKPAKYKLISRCFACVGAKDSLQTSPAPEMFSHLSERFSDFESLLISEGDHELEPNSMVLFEHLERWVTMGTVHAAEPR